MSRFQFVADNSATFEVKRLCELVEIERSSYYAWLKAAPAREERARADAELAERIRAVHAEDNTCGAPRITAELNDNTPAGERVNHKRVARVMRAEGIRGYVKRRRVRTTIPEPSGQKYPDLLQRDFTAERPNRRYVGDITYLPLADGSNLYLATVIDCYSRRLVGWAIADHMRTELVEDAHESIPGVGDAEPALARAAVALVDDGLDLGLCRGGRQILADRDDADLRAVLVLGADVPAAAGVVADEDRAQAGGDAALAQLVQPALHRAARDPEGA